MTSPPSDGVHSAGVSSDGVTSDGAPHGNAVVSSDTEELILVDLDDAEVGHLSKAAAHDGDGVLHRAFSLFLLDARGRVLLQQRSPSKRLWPGFWANSVCSHPRRGEMMELATARRLEQELGVAAELEFCYKFDYHARFGELGSERELCWVYLGRVDRDVHPNHTEIAAVRWVAPSDLDRELAAEPDSFTPWLHLEWREVRGRLLGT